MKSWLLVSVTSVSLTACPAPDEGLPLTSSLPGTGSAGGSAFETESLQPSLTSRQTPSGAPETVAEQTHTGEKAES